MSGGVGGSELCAAENKGWVGKGWGCAGGAVLWSRLVLTVGVGVTPVIAPTAATSPAELHLGTGVVETGFCLILPDLPLVCVPGTARQVRIIYLQL